MSKELRSAFVFVCSLWLSASVAQAAQQNSFPPLESFGTGQPMPGQGGVQPMPGTQPVFPQAGAGQGGVADQQPMGQDVQGGMNMQGGMGMQDGMGMQGGTGTQPGLPQQGGFGGQQPTANGGQNAALIARLDQMTGEERRDFGVPATAQLHAGAMHGPTPSQIPGGQVLTTKGLVALMQGAGTPFLVFDVLGAGEVLPGAISAVRAAAAGTFQDQTQQQFGQFLAQMTRQNPDVPLVFYCQGVNCWMSYNAALRAINLGYRNVLWYRGGLEAWKYAGLPTQPQQQPAR